MHSVIFFDGVCHLCQGAVQFIIKRDPASYFKFASLQSKVAREMLNGIEEISADRSMDTIVLYEEGRFYTHSTASLRIARRLRFPWSLAYVLIIIPKFIRDAVYRRIADNRYRLFGRDHACLLPNEEYKGRFLN